jgi:YD repeat-containing protein
MTTSNSYDTAGRLVKTVDNAGIETIYQYSNNGLTSTVIRAGLTNRPRGQALNIKK